MSASTPAPTATADEDEVDPLDAYMASLAGEATEQARGTSVSPPPPGPATGQQPPPLPQSSPSSPSPAIRAIVDKVSASPFCDVLSASGNAGGRRRAGVDHGRDHPNGSFAGTAAYPADNSGTQQNGGRPAAAAAAAAACLTLLTNQPAEFLRRFGHILSPDDLDSLLPCQDPTVTLHIGRLKSLMLSQEQRQNEQQRDRPIPSLSTMDDDVDMHPSTTGTAPPAGRVAGGAAGAGDEGAGGSGGGGDAGRGRQNGVGQSSARVRNRRYRRLQQLAEGGVWFSDEAMKERDPWLWFEHVGRRAGEEKPAPKRAVEEVPGSTSVGTYLQESLGFLSQQQPRGGWPTDGMPIDAVAGGTGGPRPGAGSALGMAFLSGVCADVGGARDVEAGEDVDCSDFPPASPTRTPTPGVPDVSRGVPAIGDGQRPDEDADVDGMDTSDAAEVTAAVAAIGIQDSSGDGRDTVGEDGGGRADDGGGRQGDADGRHRRVHFAQGVGEDEEEGDDGDDDSEDAMQEDGEEDSEEEEGVEGTEGGRDEVARILSERFLSGLEKGVDYRGVDGDERLDDLEQLSRDEQDRWFHSEDRDSSMD
ncbi:unnamed protein product [Scytosiphon promiscuus]